MLTISQFRKDIGIKINNETEYSAGYMLKNCDLDLRCTLSSGVDLQRGLVWGESQKQAFIISLLRGISIPNLVAVRIFADKGKDRLIIIDGKQRVSTIIAFSKGEFPLEVDGQDYFWKDLGSLLQDTITGTYLRFKIAFLGDMPGDSDLIDLYEMLGYTGTPQEKEHLNNVKNKSNAKP
jgi:hypothetical protein